MTQDAEVASETLEDAIDVAWQAIDDRNDMDVGLRDFAQAAVEALAREGFLRAGALPNDGMREAEGAAQIAVENGQCFDIEAYIRSLSWGDDATDLEKTLVAGNLRTLYHKLNEGWFDLLRLVDEDKADALSAARREERERCARTAEKRANEARRMETELRQVGGAGQREAADRHGLIANSYETVARDLRALPDGGE